MSDNIRINRKTESARHFDIWVQDDNSKLRLSIERFADGSRTLEYLCEKCGEYHRIPLPICDKELNEGLATLLTIQENEDNQ